MKGMNLKDSNQMNSQYQIRLDSLDINILIADAALLLIIIKVVVFTFWLLSLGSPKLIEIPIIIMNALYIYMYFYRSHYSFIRFTNSIDKGFSKYFICLMSKFTILYFNSRSLSYISLPEYLIFFLTYLFISNHQESYKLSLLEHTISKYLKHRASRDEISKVIDSIKSVKLRELEETFLVVSNEELKSLKKKQIRSEKLKLRKFNTAIIQLLIFVSTVSYFVGTSSLEIVFFFLIYFEVNSNFKQISTYTKELEQEILSQRTEILDYINICNHTNTGFYSANKQFVKTNRAMDEIFKNIDLKKYMSESKTVRKFCDLRMEAILDKFFLNNKLKQDEGANKMQSEPYHSKSLRDVIKEQTLRNEACESIGEEKLIHLGYFDFYNSSNLPKTQLKKMKAGEIFRIFEVLKVFKIKNNKASVQTAQFKKGSGNIEKKRENSSHKLMSAELEEVSPPLNNNQIANAEGMNNLLSTIHEEFTQSDQFLFSSTIKQFGNGHNLVKSCQVLNNFSKHPVANQAAGNAASQKVPKEDEFHLLEIDTSDDFLIYFREVTDLLKKNNSNVETKYKNIIFAKLSHEIKTPCYALNYYIDEIENLIYQTRCKTHHKSIIEETLKIKVLVDQIINSIFEMNEYTKGLDISKTELNDEVNLKELIDWSFWLLNALLETNNDKNIQIIINDPENYGRLSVKTHERFLKIIISEIIKNSVKYTQKGHIEIKLFIEQPQTVTCHNGNEYSLSDIPKKCASKSSSATSIISGNSGSLVKQVKTDFEKKKEEGFIIIAISDSGAGFSEKKVIELVQEFNRIDNFLEAKGENCTFSFSHRHNNNVFENLDSFADKGGLNLGLKLIKGFAYKLGIGLIFKSDPNKGTSFFLRIGLNSINMESGISCNSKNKIGSIILKHGLTPIKSKQIIYRNNVVGTEFSPLSMRASGSTIYCNSDNLRRNKTVKLSSVKKKRNSILFTGCRFFNSPTLNENYITSSRLQSKVSNLRSNTLKNKEVKHEKTINLLSVPPKEIQENKDDEFSIGQLFDSTVNKDSSSVLNPVITISKPVNNYDSAAANDLMEFQENEVSKKMNHFKQLQAYHESRAASRYDKQLLMCSCSHYLISSERRFDEGQMCEFKCEEFSINGLANEINLLSPALSFEDKNNKKQYINDYINTKVINRDNVSCKNLESSKIKVKQTEFEANKDKSLTEKLVNNFKSSMNLNSHHNALSLDVKPSSSTGITNQFLDSTIRGPNEFFKNFSDDYNIILVVDDDSFCRKSMKSNIVQALAKLNYTNYIVKKLADGIDAINSVIEDSKNKHSIKLIISDENMSYIFGSESFTIISRIIQRSSIPEIPLIIITALEDDETLKEIQRVSKCQEVIKKPMTKTEVQKILTKYLPKTSSA